MSSIDPTVLSLDDMPRAESAAISRRKPFLLALLVCAVALCAVMVDVLLLSRSSTQPGAASAVLPAVAQLREIVDLAAKHPTDAEVRLTLAQCLQVAGHNLSAREEYSRALVLGADPVTALAGRARANLAILRYDLAAADFNRLLDLHPGLASVCTALAECEILADDVPGARLALGRIPYAADGLPQAEPGVNRAATVEQVATSFSHLNDWTAGLRLLDRSLAVLGDRSSTRIMRGKALHTLGKKREAIPDLEAAVKTAPDVSELRYLLGTAYLARGNPGDLQSAGEMFLKAVELDSAHGQAWFELGKLEERAGRRVRAADAYYAAGQLGVENSRPILRSGDMLLKLGNKEEGWYRRGLYFETVADFKSAFQEYQKLTTLHSCCRSGYIHIARLYQSSNRPARVVEYLKKAGIVEPAKAKELRWLLAQAYQDLRDDVSRDNVLHQIVAGGGDEAVAAKFKLAQLADKNGRFEQTESLLNQCVAAKPNDGEYRLALGKQYLQRRDDPAILQKAIGELEAAVHAGPRNADAYYQLGLAYSAANRVEDSVLALRHTIDLAPDVGDGYQTLAKVLETSGRRDAAREMQQTFLRYRSFEQGRQTLVARVNREPKNALFRLRLGQFLLRAKDYAAAAGQFKSCLVLTPDDRQAKSGFIAALRQMGRPAVTTNDGSSSSTAEVFAN